MFPSEIIHPNG